MPTPELVAAIYPWLRPLHITLVTLSVALFAVRGLGVLAGQAWPMAGWARGLAPVIDSLLLLAGGTLWWLLQLNPTQNHWLLAKLVLLIVYIVLGTLALKRAPTRGAKALCFVAALAVVGFMVSIAVAHHPLGLFAP
ncbi:SirB2 family protein [Hydrogenophaga pseudoflava]|uniref:SirB2 family protein n=1 Tax=Hydrogenophaga pseudoflava TaxID=47421 RepID=UPI0027E3DE66|nr:SirB2 family protein [Hydrogenophaga pseudoflava]MDQ7747080.1 SirB2 family protein [Hydrogenophaga pseudoflava]